MDAVFFRTRRTFFSGFKIEVSWATLSQVVWVHNIQLSLVIFYIVLWVSGSSWNSISLGRILVPSLCASQRVTVWTVDRTVNCLHRRNLHITARWTSGSISDPLQQRHTSAVLLPAVWVGRWTDSESQIDSVHLSLRLLLPDEQGGTHRRNVTRDACQ